MKQIFLQRAVMGWSHLCKVGQEKPVSLCFREKNLPHAHAVGCCSSHPDRVLCRTTEPYPDTLSVESHVKDTQYGPTSSHLPLILKSPIRPNIFHLPVISHLQIIFHEHMKLFVTLLCQTLPSHGGEINHCHC